MPVILFKPWLSGQQEHLGGLLQLILVLAILLEAFEEPRLIKQSYWCLLMVGLPLALIKQVLTCVFDSLASAKPPLLAAPAGLIQANCPRRLIILNSVAKLALMMSS